MRSERQKRQRNNSHGRGEVTAASSTHQIRFSNPAPIPPDPGCGPVLWTSTYMYTVRSMTCYSHRHPRTTPANGVARARSLAHLLPRLSCISDLLARSYDVLRWLQCSVIGFVADTLRRVQKLALCHWYDRPRFRVFDSDGIDGS